MLKSLELAVINFYDGYIIRSALRILFKQKAEIGRYGGEDPAAPATGNMTNVY